MARLADFNLKELLYVVPIPIVLTTVFYVIHRKQGADVGFSLAAAWLTGGFIFLTVWLLRKYKLV